MRLRALRIRTTAPWLARLALFALLFQIVAIDHHWHPSTGSVSGVPGTSNHEMHCHGAAGSCANGGGAVAELPSAVRSPAILVANLSTFLIAQDSGAVTPDNAHIEVLTEPPRI